MILTKEKTIKMIVNLDIITTIMAFMKCPKCGAILDRNDTVCGKCGHFLHEVHEKWTRDLSHKVTKPKIVWLILLIVFAITTFVFLMLGTTDKKLVTKPNGLVVEEVKAVWCLLCVLFASLLVVSVMFFLVYSIRKVMVATYDGRSVAVYRSFLETSLWIDNKQVEKKNSVGILSFTAELPTGKHVFISCSRDICTFELVEKEEENN